MTENANAMQGDAMRALEQGDARDDALVEHTDKTLRQLLTDFSDYELDCVCTNLKTTLKTPRGSSLKHDFSARRNAMLARRGGRDPFATGGSDEG